MSNLREKIRDMSVSFQSKALATSRRLKLPEAYRELKREWLDLSRWLGLPEISTGIQKELIETAQWLKADIYHTAADRILSILRRFNVRTTLAIAGIIGPMMLTAGDITAALNTTGYNLVRDSISSLALTRIGWLQTIGFLALGLLVEIFTAGLLLNIKKSRWFHLGIAALVIFGFGMLCIGAFNTDPAGSTIKSINGRIHGYATMVSFSLFPVAAWLLSRSFKKDPDWKHMFRYSQVTAIISIVLAVTLQFFKDGNNIFGLVERLVVANIIIWVEVAAINLLRLSFKVRPQVEKPPQTG
jgi:hypothetical membrane protein